MRAVALVLVIAAVLLAPGCLESAAVTPKGLAANEQSGTACSAKGTVIEERHDVPLTEASRRFFVLPDGCGLELRIRFTAMVGTVKFRLLHGEDLFFETDGGVNGPLLVGRPDARQVLSPAPAGGYVLEVDPTHAVSYELTLSADDARALGAHA